VAYPASLMTAYYGVGYVALDKGDLHTALPWLEHAVRICREADFPTYFPRMAAALGAAYNLGGRIADAISLLTQALAQLTAMTSTHFETVCSLSLSGAYLLDGRLEAAQARAERALALARAHQECGHQAKVAIIGERLIFILVAFLFFILYTPPAPSGVHSCTRSRARFLLTEQGFKMGLGICNDVCMLSSP
jgi:tetratricopeptide (TPR) repeat protein